MKLSKKILCVIAIIISTMLISINIAKATTVEITTETLNLRREPSTDSDIVAQISIGEECELLGEEGDWYQVSYGDYTGYISKEYAKLVGSESENSTGDSEGNSGSSSDNNTEDTSEGNGADAQENSGGISTQENTTDNNNTVDNSADDNNGNTNTVSDANGNNSDASDVSETNTIQPPKNVTATTTAETSIRITPLIYGSVLDTLENNVKVTVITQMNGWAYVQTDEISGWVRSDILDIAENSDDQNTNNGNENDMDNNENSSDTNGNGNTGDNNSSFEARTMYTIDYVNIRKEPSTSSEKIMVVEQNTALRVVGESGDWYEVETSQGNAYVSKEVLSNERVSVTNRGSIDRNEISNTNDKNNEEAGVADTSTSNSSENLEIASQIVSYAKEFLGIPYVYGGASPSGFDCSGFTMYVFDHFGISMRHGAQAQAKLGTAVNADKSSKTSLLNNLKVGDLVFFLDYETMDEIGHCGIYIGNGNFIHASSGSGYCVKINSLLPGEYYNTRYCAARRVL